MHPEESWQDRASLNMSPERYRKVLVEYYKLTRLPKLDEFQSSRILEILEMAEYNDMLSFLLNEIDEISYQELGFNDDFSKAHFKDEASKVQEIIPDRIDLDRELLNQFAVASKSNNLSPWGQYYSYPRVEMAFDSSYSTRLRFEKVFSQDAAFLCPKCGDFSHRRNIYGECRYCFFFDDRPFNSFSSFFGGIISSILAYVSLTLILIIFFLLLA